jgi:serine phosphatase RsbU (regulator of sigma subunit)
VNILNEIVRENHITSPDNILSELNEGIVTGLKQRQDGTSNRDGMDAGIISLNHQLLLEFAGAMLDCLVIRNNETIILAGESYPVGGSSKSFSVKAIQLVAGDEVYLYTDGIEDREANSRFSKNLCEKASWDERKKWIRKKADSEKQKDDLLIAAIRIS